jgi:hypothetical protein
MNQSTTKSKNDPRVWTAPELAYVYHMHTWGYTRHEIAHELKQRPVFENRTLNAIHMAAVNVAKVYSVDVLKEVREKMPNDILIASIRKSAALWIPQDILSLRKSEEVKNATDYAKSLTEAFKTKAASMASINDKPKVKTPIPYQSPTQYTRSETPMVKAGQVKDSPVTSKLPVSDDKKSFISPELVREADFVAYAKEILPKLSTLTIDSRVYQF